MIGGLFKSASRVAIIAAAGVLAGGVAAQAADLGGNCCADLEERVAELEATTARKGNRKVSLTVYGMVSKSILWHDDDAGFRPDELQFRDPSQVMSRFGFRGEASIRPDLTAGYVLEFGLHGEDFDVNSSGDSFSIRHSYVYLDSQSLGRVSLGQTSTATDGIWQISLANTMVLPGELGEEGGVLSAPLRSTFAVAFDGHRYRGIHYRTPTLAGFTLSTSYFTTTYQGSTLHTGGPDDRDDNDAWDIALRYAGEFNGIRLAAGIGYREETHNGGWSASNGTDLGEWGPTSDFGKHKVLAGSASVMHMPTGLFVSGGYADRDSTGTANDRDAWWLQAGIEKNWTGIGNTTIYGEYADFDLDETSGHSDGNYWGGGIVQTIDSAAADIYLNFRKYELDDTRFVGEEEIAVNDATVVQAGMRINF